MYQTEVIMAVSQGSTSTHVIIIGKLRVTGLKLPGLCQAQASRLQMHCSGISSTVIYLKDN
jgi:hypothetical protein